MTPTLMTIRLARYGSAASRLPEALTRRLFRAAALVVVALGGAGAARPSRPISPRADAILEATYPADGPGAAV